MILRLAGLGLAFSLLASSAWAAPDPVVRESVAICDPNNPSHCAKPDASGNIPVTTTVNLGTLTPNALTSTPTAVTITTAGTFQQVLALNASRANCEIQNTSQDVEYVYLGAGTAATASSLVLNPGDTFVCAGALGVATDKIQMTSATVSSATAVVVAQ